MQLPASCAPCSFQGPRLEEDTSQRVQQEAAWALSVSCVVQSELQSFAAGGGDGGGDHG